MNTEATNRAPPRVFLSYSHDSEEHRRNVLGLANALKKNGVNAVMDQFVTRPSQGWPFWCEEQLRPGKSDAVLMICTPTYCRRVEDNVPPNEGKGVCWEARIIRAYLYAEKRNHRFIPILFPGGAEENIPIIVRGDGRYNIGSCEVPQDKGFVALLRDLLGKPEIVEPLVGAAPDLPPKALPYGVAGAPPAAKPRNLPYDSLGSLFKGRDEFVTALHATLHGNTAGKVAAVVGKQAIHGLGGVGKTRLAVEYALKYQNEYTALLFAGADSAGALQRNVAALCGQRVLNLTELQTKDEPSQFAAVLRWLQSHPGWLFILDNVDSPDAVSAVEELLPQLPNGHVLITSRVTAWSPAIACRELDVLGEDDAVAFLLERTKGARRTTPTDSTDARTLAKELGCLALALEQASAFIVTMRVSLADYRRRWGEREQKVLKWYDANVMKYPRSVAVTWDTTFEQLDAPARALLRLLCWFAPDPLPRAVLENESGKENLVEGVKLIHDSGEQPRADPAKAELEDAIAQLAKFSLLKWEPGNAAFRLHRLVQEVTRERLPEEQSPKWLRAALTVMNDYLPGDPPPQDVRSWPRWEPVRSHVTAVIAAADAAEITDPTSRLMSCLGLFLQEKCVWSEAEALYRRALVLDARNVGPENPKVAIRLNNLAQLLCDTNRLAEAEPLMRQALAIDEKSFGPEHSEVATDLNNLARLLQDTNRLPEAEPLMRRALAIDEMSFGPDHPRVAIRLNNLAQLLQDTNRLAEVEPLLRRALAIDEKSFGSEHPGVACHLNNLALLFKNTNRLTEAEPLLRRALAIGKKSLGSEHPSVATALNNLAQLLKVTNRLAEAEPLMREALALDEKNFGLEHPRVVLALNNLAQLLKVTNRLAEAELLMRRALAIDEKSFGLAHPDVAVVLNNLARLLQTTNRLEEAEPLMRQVVEIFLKFTEVSGHEHPYLWDAVDNYVSMLNAMGRTPAEVRAQLEAVAKPFEMPASVRQALGLK